MVEKKRVNKTLCCALSMHAKYHDIWLQKMNFNYTQDTML